VRRWLRRLVGLFAIGLTLVLASCSAQGGRISVEKAWVRPSPIPGGTGAAYMEIRNGGSEDDALTGVQIDFAESAEIHQSMTEGEMAGMQMVDEIPVPAHGKASLAPGGYHVMLINMNPDVKVGDKVTLTLTFKKAGEVLIQAEVKDQ
jgi:periplasmic copper chaperone A